MCYKLKKCLLGRRLGAWKCLRMHVQAILDPMGALAGPHFGKLSIDQVAAELANACDWQQRVLSGSTHAMRSATAVLASARSACTRCATS